jgi:hypothetical protein
MPNNTNGGSNFDTTRGVFDPNVIGEYLHWTGKKGGPLVTSNNVTTRSDLRLYESDQNATMRALFAQGNDFLNTCVDLMARAMNTVPTSVQLGSPIDAIPLKPINVTFDFDTHGKLKLSGNIRVLTAADSPPPSSLTLQISNHSSRIVPEPATGSSVFGQIGSTYGTSTYFPFSLSGPQIRSTTSFSLSTSTLPDAVQNFPIASETFIVPSLTKLTGTSLNATIAILPSHTCQDVSLLVAAPGPQHGTLAPIIRRQGLAIVQLPGMLDGYTICSGSVVLEDVPTGLVTVKAAVQGQAADLYMVNGGAAGW